MPTQAEFIETALAEYRATLAQLPAHFQSVQRQGERQIDLLCEEAGIMGKVQEVREGLKRTQKQLQSQADTLQGQIAALTLIFEKYHLAPIPEGVTHMYGIELESLDPNTRLIVMHGQENPIWEETIHTLGGDPDFKEWDGTYEEEGDEDIAPTQYEEDPFIDDLIVAVTDTEEEEDDIVHDLFAPKTSPLDDLLEEDAPAPSPIAAIADEISEIERKLEEGTASDGDLARVNELTSQLHDVLGE